MGDLQSALSTAFDEAVASPEPASTTTGGETETAERETAAEPEPEKAPEKKEAGFPKYLRLAGMGDIVDAAKQPKRKGHHITQAIFDKNAKYESVVKVMDTLQRAGIERVGLSVQLAN